MEIPHSSMNAKQRAYRSQYRDRIVGWYSGWIHVAAILLIGALAIKIYISNLNDVTIVEWLTIPIVLILCNFFEWFIHLHVMHRPLRFPGLRAVYTRHTLMHHQFFTEEEMRFAHSHDWRVTFFPPYALIVFSVASIPPALICGWLVSENVGWLVILSTTCMYLIYEFMHFCCHVDDNWFVRSCPFINTIRRHHTAHHNQTAMMRRNMNLTFPIADWFFGTSDLDRGLIGHLLNGNSKTHVKSDMSSSQVRK